VDSRAVSDVSALGAVRVLALTHCRRVTDVSALGGVQDLSLEGCTGVTDVSALWRSWRALDGTRRLCLHGCTLTGVTEVSALGAVRALWA